MKEIIRRYFGLLFFGIIALIILKGTFEAEKKKIDLTKSHQDITINNLEEKQGSLFATVENDVFDYDGETVVLKSGTRLKGFWRENPETGRKYIEWKSYTKPSITKDIK